MAKNDILVSWLNDAHAMEQSQIEMLERFIKDYDSLPEIQSSLQQHLAETRIQAEDVKACITNLGGNVSGGKSLIGKMMGAAQGMSTGMSHDEIVKNLLMLYAGEHFEYISYMALVDSARALNAADIADVCQRIADQEMATADLLKQNLPTVVAAVLEERNR